MEEGIYSVTFESSSREWGIGLVVVENGKIQGGDLSFIYRGKYKIDGDLLKADIHVSHYRGEPISIFGSIMDFNLRLSGNFTGNSFKIKGSIVEQPQFLIQVTGEKVSALIND